MNIGPWHNGEYNIGAWQGSAAPLAVGTDLYYNLSVVPKTEEITNAVVVSAELPVLDSTDSDIYDSDETFSIPTGETEITVTIKWSTVPVDPDTVVIARTVVSGTSSISSSDIYVWGARVYITGTGGSTFSLSATGRASTLSKTQYVTEDTDSINEYGKKTYDFPTNHLVQSFELAKEIGDSLLPLYKDLRKDARIQWPGNTIVEISDLMNVTEFDSDTVTTNNDFYIIKQVLKFNGALDVDTELRRKVD